MSTESIEKFWVRLAEDESLRRRMRAIFAVGGERRAIAADRVVALGKAHGYEFTVAELRTSIAEQTAADAESDELTDDELDMASGGGTMNPMAFKVEIEGLKATPLPGRAGWTDPGMILFHP